MIKLVYFFERSCYASCQNRNIVSFALVIVVLFCRVSASDSILVLIAALRETRLVSVHPLSHFVPNVNHQEMVTRSMLVLFCWFYVPVVYH